MNLRLTCVLLAAIGVAVALPSSEVHSQLAPPPSDPMVDLQAIQTANDNLIKRQEATLNELADTTELARQLRIFANRG